jgi:hypothetical protein
MESSRTTQEEEDKSNHVRGNSIEREVMSHQEEMPEIRKKKRKFSQGKSKTFSHLQEKKIFFLSDN